MLKINNIYIILLFILALFISPFILPENIIYSFLTGPRLWLYVVTGIILLITAGKLLIFPPRPGLHIKIITPDILISLILLTILIKRFFLDDSVYFTDKIIEYACLTTIYFILRFYVWSLSQNKLQYFTTILICMILMVTMVSSCYGLLQLYNFLPNNNPDFKVTGHFYNPARYANYLIALLPFCISAYFLFPKRSKLQLFIHYSAAIVCLTGLLVLPITYTRAAWLGIAGATGMILYYKYRTTLSKLIRNIWVISAMVVLVFSMAFILYKMKPASAGGRLTIWEISMGIVKENPFTGIGYGSFGGAYGNYQARYFAEAPYNEQKAQGADVVRYAYNVFLQILCEQGIIGLILFLLLLSSIIPKENYKGEIANTYGKFLTIGSWSSILAILVCGQFSYPFDILPVLVIFFINMGLLAGVKATQLKGSRFLGLDFKKFVIKRYALKLIGTFLLISAALLFYVLKQKHIAYKTWLELSSGSSSTDLQSIYQLLKDDIDFLNLFSQKLLDEKKYNEVINILENSKNSLMYPNFYFNLAQAYAATNQYDKADSNFKFASDMIPNRFYSKFLWLQFYYDTKQYNRAIELSENILNMKVKVPSSAVNEIRYKTQEILTECENLK